MKKFMKIVGYVALAYVLIMLFLNMMCYMISDSTKEVYIPTWNFMELDNGFVPLEAVQ